MGNSESIFDKMRKKMMRYSKEETALDETCMFCTSLVRIEDFATLKKGDHICMGGEKLLCNVGSNQISFYKHHAIVNDVKCINEASANLTLIHFSTTAHDHKLKVRRMQIVKDLTYDEIYLVKYSHKVHFGNRVIERAESFLGENAEYSVLYFNCEHFCNWCCTSNEESFQVHYFREMLDIMFSSVGIIAGTILKFATRMAVMSADELALLSGVKKSTAFGVVTGGAILHLIYYIYRHICLNKYSRKGTICESCCWRQKRDLWCKFAVYCLMQTGGLGLFSVVMESVRKYKSVVIGLVASVGILTAVLMWRVPKVIKRLGSPFKGKRVKISTLETIGKGDVISLNNIGNAVVSEIEIKPATDSKEGTLTIIHYALFSRVIEEKIAVNLKRDSIIKHKYEYVGLRVHQPEIVVQRAKKRIGEEKYGFLSNRSSHLCNWAKVDISNENETKKTSLDDELRYKRDFNLNERYSGYTVLNVDHRRRRVHSSKIIEEDWVRIRDEITEGQLIRFKYRIFNHYAVSTAVKSSEHSQSIVSISIVHYGKDKIVVEETITFDLNHKDIWITKYHPIYKFKRKDIIHRAREKIGENKYSYRFRRSSHLAKEIMEKLSTRLARRIDDIHVGDAITIQYWSLLHDAIVTRLDFGDGKLNNIGKMSIIHYALDQFLETRTVKEESICIDLNKEDVYIKGYSGYVTYPAKVVVKRARERIGEQRFSVFWNTSSDLVHWAKVVQIPAIVRRTNDKDERLLIPTIDMPIIGIVPSFMIVVDKFQLSPAVTWSDLTQGIIVGYYYCLIPHYGIITETNRANKTIRVVHYGTEHILATRTVTERTKTVNLKRDTIWVYRPDPKYCNTPEKIIKLAKSRVGEQEWGMGNTSWNLCKACVLKCSIISKY